MIPLADDNPTHSKPIITIGLIVICCIVFLWQLGLGQSNRAAILALGVIPASLLQGALLPEALRWISPELTLITSMFLHGGWMHLIGNMAYLWIFGNNIEDYLGHIKFLIFYLFCGVCATLIHVFSDANSTIPVIGASGAISGILGAYLILYPRAKVRLLVWFGIVTILRVRASIVLIFWFVYQFLSVLKSTGEGGGVAWWAHIGGFIAGILLIFLLKNKKIVQREKGPWE